MTGITRAILYCGLIGGLLALAAASAPRSLPAAPDAQFSHSPIEHLVVIYLENWSFDALYGGFPGVDGLTPGPGTPTPLPQADRTGVPLTSLPRPLVDNDSNGEIPPHGTQTPDTRFPATLGPGPLDLMRHVRPDDPTPTGDMIHRFFNEQYQIDGGRMDKFAAYTDNPGLVMTYYDRA